MSDGESQPIGRGIAVGVGAPVSGLACFVRDLETVVRLLNEDVSERILVVREAGATGLGPVLPDARGIVCTTGGPTSHLALVAKEYGVPAVMGAAFEVELEDLDGVGIELDPSGSITRGQGG